MKLKSIEIQGMHKVKSAKYELDGLTYFVGPNGAGKSTILQAIQLALLGYIPGYSKTNESIMKHANGPVLSVTIEIDDDGRLLSLTRTWIRQSTSVSSSTTSVNQSLTPEALKEMLEDMELPLFNFNEFRNMTANKLKDWFISMLPSDTSANIDWNKEFYDALATRPGLLTDEDLAMFAAEATELEAEHDSAIDLVKAVNAKLKDDQSFYKGEITSTENTINSLVYNEDAAEYDEEELDAEYAKLQEDLKSAASAKMTKSHRQAIEARLASIGDKKSLEATIADMEEIISVKEEELAKLGEALQMPVAPYSQAEYAEVHSKAVLARSKVTSDVCPYTNAKCAEISARVEVLEAEAKEAEAAEAKMLKEMEAYSVEAKKVEAHNSKLGTEQATLESAIRSAQAKIESTNHAIELYDATKSELATLPLVDVPYDEAAIQVRMQEIVKLKGKIAANARYNELIDKLTQDKFKYVNYMEALKIWTKLTDVNGMQNELVQKPFANMADKMTQYLRTMFETDDVECKFNLSSKANSFSFGIVIDNTYIEYDLLSSGEKCLYMFAMMMCLASISNSKLNVILLDDALDHLDDAKATELYSTLSKLNDIQIIMAGVKACDKEFVREVK